MKNINKILSVVGTSIIATTIPTLTLTGCSCSSAQNRVRTVQSSAQMIGSDEKVELTYSLDSALNEGESLVITHPQTKEFTFYEPVVRNNVVSLTVLKGEDCHNGSLFKNQIEFVCKKDNNTVWTSSADCLVLYTAGATLKDKATVYTEKNKIEYTYNFELDEDPSKNNQYVYPYIVQDTEKSTEGITISISDTKIDGKNLSVTVKLTTEAAEYELYDHANFSFEIYCLDSDSKLVWHKSEKNLELFYTTNIEAIPEDDCTVVDGVLTKIELSGSSSNTLDLTKGKLANVTEIADDLLNNSANGKYDQVKALILNDKCVTFGDNAFKDTNIKYINMCAMPDDAEWFYSGGFGTDSFAGLPATGTIVYNESWSSYKKHRMKVALYKAGLTSSNWYDVTWVEDAFQLKEALEMGGFIKIKKSFTIPATLNLPGLESGVTKDWCEEIEVQRSSILDLNGCTIDAEAPVYYTTEEEEKTALFAIWNGAEFVVEDTSTNGTGTVKVFDEKLENMYEREGSTYCFNVHADNVSRYSPSLTITGGNFIGARSVIHNNGAQVVIEGGNFHLTKDSVKKWNKHYSHATEANGCIYMLNCKGSSYKAGEADFWISGGRFYGWSFPDSSYGIKNYFDPSSSQDDYKEEGGIKYYANYLYDHDEKTVAESAYNVLKVTADPTEEGAEGYYEVALKH